VLLLRFSIEKGIDKKWNNGTDLNELLGYFILAITVIVVAIPEGLPLSFTLSFGGIGEADVEG
jgi:Ca2+ transporting ATPase